MLTYRENVDEPVARPSGRATEGMSHKLRVRAIAFLAFALVAVVPLVVAIALPYATPLAHLFGLVAIPAMLLATLLGVVVAYVVATEVAKRTLARHATGVTPAPAVR